MTDDEFLRAFQECTFTRSEWTHEAHVRMAWLYLTRLPFVEALDRVRCGIRKLNAKIGTPDGYHETITVAFVRVIANRVRLGEDYPAFHDRNRTCATGGSRHCFGTTRRNGSGRPKRGMGLSSRTWTCSPVSPSP